MKFSVCGQAPASAPADGAADAGWKAVHGPFGFGDEVSATGIAIDDDQTAP